MVKKKKSKSKAPQEYDTTRQPMWVSDPKWDAMWQLNGEGNDGQRAYLYREKGFVIIANKDWEKNGDTLPGKTVKLDIESMDTLLKKYAKMFFDFDLEIEE